VALGLLVVAWALPWAETRPDPFRPARAESGALRTGAVGALAALAAWGLSVAAYLARTRRGLRIGEAVTSFALAAATGVLVAADHPWIPGGDRRAAWTPIFLPLALLALLDLWAARRVRESDGGGEVAAIRAGSAAVAALALIVANQPLPAAVATWLCAAAFASLLPRTAWGTRRWHDLLSLAAAVAILFGPDLLRRIASIPKEIRPLSPAPVAYRAAAAAFVAFVLAQALRPARRDGGP
jgi:hypothetical protein